MAENSLPSCRLNRSLVSLNSHQEIHSDAELSAWGGSEWSWLLPEAGALPVAEKLVSEALSIPIFGELGEERRERVVEVVKSFFKS